MSNWLDEHGDLSADDRELYEGKNFSDSLTMLKEGAVAHRRLAKSASEEWLDNHEGLSDEDKQTHSKYKSLEESLKGSAHAIRQVGKSVQMPDDKTSDEDRATFNEKIAAYQGVPKTAEAYVLDAKLPDGIEKDEELDKGFRAVASESKAPQNIAAKLYDWYNGIMTKRHEAMQTQAKEAEAVYKKEIGDKEFDLQFGKPNDKENIGTCKMALLHISKEIKADYKDEAGNPQSHLIDDLELVRKNGAIGDKVWVAKMVNLFYQNYVKEGVTFTGDAETKKGIKGTKDELFSDKWYDNPDNKPEEESG